MASYCSSFWNLEIPSGKLTQLQKISHFQLIYLFKMVILYSSVGSPEGTIFRDQASWLQAASAVCQSLRYIVTCSQRDRKKYWSQNLGRYQIILGGCCFSCFFFGYVYYYGIDSTEHVSLFVLPGSKSHCFCLTSERSFGVK